MKSKLLISGLSAFALTFAFVSKVSAEAIPVGALQASVQVGSVTNLQQMFIFAFNLLRYIGWAGVILGVGLAIFALIYKLFGTESEETMKTVQGNITKAVIIVIAGILLISAGFIVNTVANLIGANQATFSVGEELST